MQFAITKSELITASRQINCEFESVEYAKPKVNVNFNYLEIYVNNIMNYYIYWIYLVTFNWMVEIFSASLIISFRSFDANILNLLTFSVESATQTIFRFILLRSDDVELAASQGEQWTFMQTYMQT